MRKQHGDIEISLHQARFDCVCNVSAQSVIAGITNESLLLFYRLLFNNIPCVLTKTSDNQLLSVKAQTCVGNNALNIYH